MIGAVACGTFLAHYDGPHIQGDFAMSRKLTISDNLYRRLESISRAQGFNSVEELIEQSIQTWQPNTDELHRRQAVVQRIDALRERLFSRYGELADSVDLIRADRER
jgi:hypothetical protein